MTSRRERPMRLPQQRRGNAGFGLLGMLIVMAIVLYMMFGTGGSGKGSYADAVKNTRDQGIETAFNINVQQLSILIAQYRQEHNGKLPTTVAELEAGPGAFMDPWKKEMTFSFKQEAASTQVTYRSAGRDGEFNTADDVTATGPLPF